MRIKKVIGTNKKDIEIHIPENLKEMFEISANNLKAGMWDQLKSDQKELDKLEKGVLPSIDGNYYTPSDWIGKIRDPIDKYDPTKINTEQLHNDWKLSYNWANSIQDDKIIIKDGKVLTYTDCINLGTKIAKELIKRDAITFSRDEKNTKYNEYLDKIINNLKKEEIEVPEQII